MKSVLENWEAIKTGEVSAPQRASDFVEFARKLKQAGNSPEAAQAFSQAFEIDPGCPEACFGLASLLVEAGQLEAAVELRTLGLDLSRSRYRQDASLPSETGVTTQNVWVATGNSASAPHSVNIIRGQLAEDAQGNWLLDLVEY